jgi:hypothetical protein
MHLAFGALDYYLRVLSLSPALETALDYYLRVLALSITHAGPALPNYTEELMHIITSAFPVPSWKVSLFFSFLNILIYNIPIIYCTMLDDGFSFCLD